MPRYFFDVHEKKGMPDPEGVEFPDSQSLRSVAIRLAGEILRDVDGKLDGQEWSMTVRDEAGDLVMTLRFSAVEH